MQLTTTITFNGP